MYKYNGSMLQFKVLSTIHKLTYTGGVELRLIPDQFKLDGGVGYYQPIGNSEIQHNEFFYVKVIYSFDTTKK